MYDEQYKVAIEPYVQSIRNLLAAQEDYKDRIAKLEKENTLLWQRVEGQEITINALRADNEFLSR